MFFFFVISPAVHRTTLPTTRSIPNPIPGQFGFSVAMFDDRIAVGAMQDASSAGATYAFLATSTLVVDAAYCATRGGAFTGACLEAAVAEAVGLELFYDTVLIEPGPRAMKYAPWLILCNSWWVGWLGVDCFV